MKKHTFLAIIAGWFLATGALDAQTAESGGTLTGSVSNAATHNMLEGATITVPQLNLTTLTDNTGRYILTRLPAGSHEVLVSYAGLDPQRVGVTVSAGLRAVRDFELTAEIYRLDVFKVTGEREGNALALTMQRQAENIKNVVAVDSYGNLPNMSVSEVVARLPGIAGNPTPEGLLYNFNVRGMPPALNTVTIDGARAPSIGENRQFEMQSISTTLFEQVELVKGLTPDKSADSLGGAINLKSRSTLSMKEKRRFSYGATIRAAPSFTEQIPLREEHRYHPLLNFSYQEVFSVLGGERNLGVAVNLFYSENAVGSFEVTRNYQNTLLSPAYNWSYQWWNNYNNRKQGNINVKTEYRYSPNSKFTLNLTTNQNHETTRQAYTYRLYTGNQDTVPNATTSGIIPGYTDLVTQVRPTTGSNIDITNAGPTSYIVRQVMATFAGEHDYGPLKIEYNAAFGRNALSNKRVWQLVNRLSNVAWTIDGTQSQVTPRITQTAGPDMTDAANYRPVANGLTANPYKRAQDNSSFNADVSYTPAAFPFLQFKTGVSWREMAVKLNFFGWRWNYLGTAALPVDPSINIYGSPLSGRPLPTWEANWQLVDVYPPVLKDPALWREDLYYRAQQNYVGNRGVTEEVGAGYVMAKGKFGTEGVLKRTGFLAGVREEKTDVTSYGWVRARVPSTAAQQLADPVGAAARDYANNKRDLKSSYTKSFPSVHLTEDVTPNLKARVSWSTGFGRPAPNNLTPNETVNETARTVTVNNPGLLPQMAKNWDATVEYYFEPLGSITAGWFHKTIRDYIVSGMDAGIVTGGANNGYNGEYEGYQRLTSANAGTAIVQGWEFSYQQQFTFLPGAWKGLGLSVNYTKIDAAGDFGNLSGPKLASGQVAGFIPKAANVQLSWSYRGFRTRVLANLTGSHILSYNPLNPALCTYRLERKTVDLGFAYQLRPSVTLTLDISNLFKEPQQMYMGVPNRLNYYNQNFTTVTAGVSGRF